MGSSFQEHVIKNVESKGLQLTFKDDAMYKRAVEGLMADFVLLKTSGDVAGSVLKFTQGACVIMANNGDDLDTVFMRKYVEAAGFEDYGELYVACGEYALSIYENTLHIANMRLRKRITDDVVSERVMKERDFLLSVMLKAVAEDRIVESALDYSLSQVIPVYQKLHMDLTECDNSAFVIEAKQCNTYIDMGVDGLDVYTKTALMARMVALAFLAVNYGYANVEVVEMMAITLASVADIEKRDTSITTSEIEDLRDDFFNE